jgi:hypothetical protein
MPELIHFLASAAEAAETTQPEDPMVATTDEVIRILMTFVSSFDDESSESCAWSTAIGRDRLTGNVSDRNTGLHDSHSEPDNASQSGTNQPYPQPLCQSSVDACGARPQRFQGDGEHAGTAGPGTARDVYPAKRGEQAGFHVESGSYR